MNVQYLNYPTSSSMQKEKLFFNHNFYTPVKQGSMVLELPISYIPLKESLMAVETSNQLKKIEAEK